MKNVSYLAIVFDESRNFIRKAISKSECQSKNPQFLPNSYETWGKKLPHKVNIFPKFHKDWAKIVDFLLGHSDFKIAFLIKLRL